MELETKQKSVPRSTGQANVTVDATKTHIVRELKHDSPIVSCRFDPTGNLAFFGGQDNRVWRWQWTRDAKTELVGHDSWVRAIAFRSDGQVLITGGYDGRLIWWPATAETPQPTRIVDTHGGWIRAIAVSPDGSLIASVGNDHLVKLWSMKDGSLVRKMTGHECHIYNVVFHPDGQSLVTGDLKANLIHWEVATGAEVRRLKAESLYKYDGGFRADIGGFRGLTFSPDGQRLAGSGITNVTNAFAGVGNPAIVVFDWPSGEQQIQHESKGKLRGVAWGVAIHPQGFTIGISGGGGGGYLLFWNPDQINEFHQLKLPNTARDLDLSPDNLHLLTAHFDGHVRVSRMTEKA